MLDLMTYVKYLIRNAIKETVPIMDPEEDYMTIAEAEELMAKTEGVRKKELDDAQS